MIRARQFSLLAFMLFLTSIVSVGLTSTYPQNARSGSERIRTPEGSYYQFIYLQNSSYQIRWGIGNLMLTGIDTFKVLGSGVLRLKHSTKRAIILQQSCGTSCSYCVVLPLVPDAKEKVYQLPLAYDVDNDLVAFVKEGDPEVLEVKVENYLTGLSFSVKERDICSAALKIDCVDSCAIKNRELYLRWQGKAWIHDRQSPTELRITIPF